MYDWLGSEQYPRHLVRAVETIGVLEEDGRTNNPVILGWAREIGGWVGNFYLRDEIPWCGLWMAMIMRRSDRGPLPRNPLAALEWAEFGIQAPMYPCLADILVFKRKGGGHVGLYVGEDDECYHVLGGNQRDQVCVARIERSRLYAARRVGYQLTPPNVRRVFLSPEGSPTTNER